MIEDKGPIKLPIGGYDTVTKEQLDEMKADPYNYVANYLGLEILAKIKAYTYLEIVHNIIARLPLVGHLELQCIRDNLHINIEDGSI